jgi:hypothetical protein
VRATPRRSVRTRFSYPPRATSIGYTYLLTRLDDPAWSRGTTIYYHPSLEAASEAGRVALQGFLARQKKRDAL